MQLHIDSSTQAMHRHGASRALQSIKAAAARNSSPRQSVVAAASAFSSPASSSSFSPIQNGLHWSCASRAPGLLPCNMQQQLQGALALGSCLNSSSVSSSLLRSSVITSAAKRPSAPKRRISSNSGAGSSSSSSSGVSTATAAHLVQTQPSYSSSSSSTGEPAVQLSQRRYNTRSSKSSSNTGSSSGSSSSSTARSTTSALDQQHHAAVHQYLEQLNQEQQLAAYSQEQHVKVIAGPGSGKTRVVAARVAHLIASGVSPESLLVITFTRKAAGELLQRLRELLGGDVTSRLRPSTFHSLCANLLRRYRQEAKIPDFQVASEEDAEDMVKSILDNQSLKEELGWSRLADQKIKDEVSFYRKHISNIKNFCVNIDGRPGMQLIAEMEAAGRRRPGGDSPEITRRIAAMYDAYVAGMAEQQLLDFDDLLHHCLALLNNHPKVKAAVHGCWSHVLVDESQDTNLCQFELVGALTSPSSSLFMVGDPDQGIYGFRGAKTQLLSQQFTRVYGPTAATRTLSQNYRSKEPIVEVAEIVRRHGRLSSDIAAAGRSNKPRTADDIVVLMEADNEYDEADQVVLQLQKWHKAGYIWGEMAVLFRNKFHVQELYSRAIAAGIPCHMYSRVEFFDAPEVKVALALLRCLVDPLRAGDSIKKRLVKKGSTVKVPLMTGLGADSVDSLAAAFASAADGSSSSSLGSCLLGDLPAELTAEQSVPLLQPWIENKAAAAAAGADATEALQGLAPAWQPPAGVKKPTKKQLAAVDRLRGLVLLGRATAASSTPDEVLELLLEASGVLPELQAAMDLKAATARRTSKDLEELRKLRKRIGNLKTLVKLARNTAAYTESPVLGLPEVETATGFEAEYGVKSDAGSMSIKISSSDGHVLGISSNSSSSSSSSSQLPLLQPTMGLPLLQQLYDHCVLQGEDDGDDDDAEKVQLMTMHASKGKEFACVSVLRVHEGAIPSIRKDELSGSAAALEQERNLLYVAITRAKEHCLLTWPKYMYRQIMRARETGEQPERLKTSCFLVPVLAAVAKRQLPGVKKLQRRFIDNNNRFIEKK